MFKDGGNLGGWLFVTLGLQVLVGGRVAELFQLFDRVVGAVSHKHACFFKQSIVSVGYDFYPLSTTTTSITTCFNKGGY